MEEKLLKKEINLKDLLEYLGEDILKHGRNTFKLRRHDSLIIKDNKFYWNSRQVGGNYFSLLKELYSMDNKEIFEITEKYIDDVSKGIFTPSPLKNTKPELFEKLKENKEKLKRDFKVIKDYLVEKRMIDEKIVVVLEKNNLLSLDDYNNIHFKTKDFNENFNGAEVVGTGKKKFRTNTAKKSGFNLILNLSENQNITKIYVFESTIDLLSYIELNRKDFKGKFKNENVRFLSLSGLREDILSSYLKNVVEITIATDNDKTEIHFMKK